MIGLPTWYVVGILMTFSNAFAKEMGAQGPIDPGKAIDDLPRRAHFSAIWPAAT